MKSRELAFALVVFAAPSSSVFADFRRGDANQDGRVDVSDAIATVHALFRAGGNLPCEDAADTNDDGKLAIDDALATLLYLFGEGSVPSPGPLEAGPDPTCDRLSCASAPDIAPAIALSEIQYNPIGFPTLEYVELHNRTSEDVSLAGYRFTKGIDFAFPPEATIPAGGYLLVLKDPANSKWRRIAVPKAGPYDGTLADGGERITLVDGDCEVETVKYDDRAPWPGGADGTGASLERVDYLAPADDFHAWRASTSRTGTPGDVNATAGTPTRPVIAVSSFDPPQPTSTNAVLVNITLDAPRSAITKATLHWEAVASSFSPPGDAEMVASRDGDDWTLFTTTLPPQPSQTLVRMDVEVELADGRTTLLPHSAEPRAFLSYFVYDREMPAKLPILWLFQRRKSGLPFLPARTISAVVTLEPDGDPPQSPLPAPQVFDGADIRPSRQGEKLKFLKGEEYRAFRTLNMVPEEGGGGTGLMAPHMEHLGFQTFHDFGAIAPHADWFRVVDYGSVAKRHTQRLLIEEINERLLEMNGLDPSGDLYKWVYQGTEKRTNLETGMRSLNELLAKLRSSNPGVVRDAVLNELDLENVALYSVVGVLIANWDGFHNNIYIYNDLSPGARWKVIPWDLDQVFETSCAEMPVTRPLTGEGCNSREPGVISHPFHLQSDLDQAYREDLKSRIAPGGLFSVETMTAKIDAIEQLLLDDLTLQEVFLGAQRTARRSQIRSAYIEMRAYLQQRIPYLLGVLGN